MSGLLPYTVASPEGVVRTGNCELLLIPTPGGDVGLMAGHEPMLAGLAAGEIRIRSGDRVERLLVEGGTCRVRGGEARILVGRVLDPAGLDAQELAHRASALSEVASRITQPGLRAELKRRADAARRLLAVLRGGTPADQPK